MTLSNLLSKAGQILLKQTHTDVMEIPIMVRLPDGNVVPVKGVILEPPPDGVYRGHASVYTLLLKRD